MFFRAFFVAITELLTTVTTLTGRPTAPSRRKWRLPRRLTTTRAPATRLPSAAVASAETTVNPDRISSDTKSELERQLSQESSVLALAPTSTRADTIATTTRAPATRLPSAAEASAETTVKPDRISSDTKSELERQLSLESSVLALAPTSTRADTTAKLNKSDVAMDRCNYLGIALEHQDIVWDGCKNKVTGFILVRNQCYEKHVGLRHTSNNWVSFDDTPAQWVESMEDGAVDRFRFILDMPQTPLHFAVYCNGQWDNNDGKNFT